LDPRYLALTVDTVQHLAGEEAEYIRIQRQLNYEMEKVLTAFVRERKAVGSILLDELINKNDTGSNPSLDDIGLSTNYF
jgi:hypothetical protein